MTERLGELLIRKGKLTQAQLDQAVQCQILFAGKLGTVLLELGYIGEKDLAGILQERYHVEAITLEQLKEIPEEVIKSIPRDLVGKYDLIPIRKLARRVYLGMLNPEDKEAITEVEKTTGLKAIPCVLLEVYLRWVMERYYGIKREARFIQLERSLDLMRELYPYTALVYGEPGESLWQGSAPISEISQPSVKAAPLPAQAPETPSVAEPPKNLDEFWDQVGRAGHPRVLLPKIKAEFRQARSREEVARIILDFTQRIFPRVVLFYIKTGVAFGWQGRGEGIDDKRLASLMIPLELDSIIKTVYESRSYFRGQLPVNPINQRILLGIGGIIPGLTLVMPILIFGKALLILYADSGRTVMEREPDLASVQEIMGDAQGALQRILQASKKDEGQP